jgi:outer membrane protein assembly factor BamB
MDAPKMQMTHTGGSMCMDTPRKVLIMLSVTGILLFGLSSDSECVTGHRIEGSFGVKDDHVYVLPVDASFVKINRHNGNVEWKRQIMKAASDSTSPSPLEFGSFSNPFFTGNDFISIEQVQHRLLRISLATGCVLQDHFIGPTCLGLAESERPIVYGDLPLMVGKLGVRAIEPQDGTIRWEFSCAENAVTRIYDYFLAGDALYLVVVSPAEGASWDDIWGDISLQKDELVKLDPATGRVLNRYDIHSLFGEEHVDVFAAVQLGEWQGLWLLAIETRVDPSVSHYSLLTFDPSSESLSTLVAGLADLDPGKRIVIETYQKPVLMNDSIYYILAGPHETILVARELPQGTVTLSIPINAEEKLHTVGEKKLFTLISSKDSVTVICRNADTGEICWKSKPNSCKPHCTAEEIEMAFSEGRIYLLTNGCMRSLDATDGKIIWEVPLNH